jgi:hypothetical protein
MKKKIELAWTAREAASLQVEWHEFQHVPAAPAEALPNMGLRYARKPNGPHQSGNQPLPMPEV